MADQGYSYITPWIRVPIQHAPDRPSEPVVIYPSTPASPSAPSASQSANATVTAPGVSYGSTPTHIVGEGGAADVRLNPNISLEQNWQLGNITGKEYSQITGKLAPQSQPIATTIQQIEAANAMPSRPQQVPGPNAIIVEGYDISGFNAEQQATIRRLVGQGMNVSEAVSNTGFPRERNYTIMNLPYNTYVQGTMYGTEVELIKYKSEEERRYSEKPIFTQRERYPEKPMQSGYTYLNGQNIPSEYYVEGKYKVPVRFMLENEEQWKAVSLYYETGETGELKKAEMPRATEAPLPQSLFGRPTLNFNVPEPSTSPLTSMRQDMMVTATNKQMSSMEPGFYVPIFDDKHFMRYTFKEWEAYKASEEAKEKYTSGLDYAMRNTNVPIGGDFLRFFAKWNDYNKAIAAREGEMIASGGPVGEVIGTIGGFLTWPATIPNTLFKEPYTTIVGAKAAWDVSPSAFFGMTLKGGVSNIEKGAKFAEQHPWAVITASAILAPTMFEGVAKWAQATGTREQQILSVSRISNEPFETNPIKTTPLPKMMSSGITPKEIAGWRIKEPLMSSKFYQGDVTFMESGISPKEAISFTRYANEPSSRLILASSPFNEPGTTFITKSIEYGETGKPKAFIMKETIGPQYTVKDGTYHYNLKYTSEGTPVLAQKVTGEGASWYVEQNQLNEFLNNPPKVPGFGTTGAATSATNELLYGPTPLPKMMSSGVTSKEIAGWKATEPLVLSKFKEGFTYMESGISPQEKRLFDWHMREPAPKIPTQPLSAQEMLATRLLAPEAGPLGRESPLEEFIKKTKPSDVQMIKFPEQYIYKPAAPEYTAVSTSYGGGIRYSLPTLRGQDFPAGSNLGYELGMEKTGLWFYPTEQNAPTLSINDVILKPKTEVWSEISGEKGYMSHEQSFMTSTGNKFTQTFSLRDEEIVRAFDTDYLSHTIPSPPTEQQYVGGMNLVKEKVKINVFGVVKDLKPLNVRSDITSFVQSPADITHTPMSKTFATSTGEQIQSLIGNLEKLEEKELTIRQPPQLGLLGEVSKTAAESSRYNWGPMMYYLPAVFAPQSAFWSGTSKGEEEYAGQLGVGKTGLGEYDFLLPGTREAVQQKQPETLFIKQPQSMFDKVTDFIRQPELVILRQPESLRQPEDLLLRQPEELRQRETIAQRQPEGLLERQLMAVPSMTLEREPPPRIIIWPPKKEEKKKEYLVRKKKKEQITKEITGTRIVIPDLVSIWSSESRYGKATFPKQSSYLASFQQKHPSGYVPTQEMIEHGAERELHVRYGGSINPLGKLDIFGTGSKASSKPKAVSHSRGFKGLNLKKFLGG